MPLPHRSSVSLRARNASRRRAKQGAASQRRLFLESLETRDLMATQVLANVPEAAHYTQVYELQIGNANDYSGGVPYTQSGAGSIAPGSFDRIA